MENSSPNPHGPSDAEVGVIFGPGALDRLGKIILDCNFKPKHILLVSDPGIVAAGHAQRALDALKSQNLQADLFADVAENPTTDHVNAGLAFAKPREIDFFIAIGGGSAMDCAKGINFLLTNGGKMQDYWGTGKAKTPLLPLIAIPTTAGTGSDAQSYALISDPQTHQKMACGDPSALPKIAILDPELTATVPPKVAAAVGIDAISHAVESSACNRRNSASRVLSKAAWDLLEQSFELAMRDPADIDIRGRMLFGSHFAGAAIEKSMLGAAHSLANALTAICGTVHGVAVGLALPHVVRFNTAAGQNPYSDLDKDPMNLAARIDQFLTAGNLPRKLAEIGATESQIPTLAAFAAKQWTANFNPRPVAEADFRQILLNAL